MFSVLNLSTTWFNTNTHQELIVLLLTEWVHRLDGLWRLDVLAAAILVLSGDSEGVGCSLHQVLQHHAAFLGCGAHRHPLSGCSVLLLNHEVSDASTAVVLRVFPGQVGGVTSDVGHPEVLDGAGFV